MICDRRLSQKERRVQIILSTIFTITVTVFGAFLIFLGISQWANREVTPLGGLALIGPGAIFGFHGHTATLEPVRSTALMTSLDDPIGVNSTQ